MFLLFEEFHCVTFGLLNKKCVIFICCSAAKKKLFFHESICKIKMNTGGKLIWTAGCQMPITGAVGEVKWAQALVSLIIYSVSFLLWSRGNRAINITQSYQWL